MLGIIILFIIVAGIIYGLATREYWEDISDPDDKEDLL